MKRTWMMVLLVNLLLSACAPVTVPTSAPSATPMSVAVLAPTSTAMPTATATPSPTPTNTATPSPTPTATPTPIPTLPPEQVGGLTGVPDPRVTNPELFDLTRPDAPIPQFVNAMRSGGIEVLPEEVLNNLTFEHRQYPIRDENGNVVEGKMRDYILATYTIQDEQGNFYLTGFFAEQQNGEWVWRQLTTLQGANWRNILIGVEVDPGHPNDHEPGYRNFVFNHTNLFVVSGAMAHAWIKYGKTFVPEMVNGYYRQNPHEPLTLGIGILFYHHQQENWPRELYDENIPLEERKEILYQFINNHLNDVFTIISPLMKRHPSLRVVANLSNEAFWEYYGKLGWEGEYTDWPLYDILGKNWIGEVYYRFEQTREKYGISPDRFTLLMNDYGTQIPGLKSEIYLSQRRMIIEGIAERMGASPKVGIGIQFGLLNTYGNEYVGKYIRDTLYYLNNQKGRKTLTEHLNNMRREGDIYVTELFSGDTDTLIKVFDVLMQVDSIRMINFWDSLNRNQPSHIGIINKDNYSLNNAYYNLLYHLIQR